MHLQVLRFRQESRNTRCSMMFFFFFQIENLERSSALHKIKRKKEEAYRECLRIDFQYASILSLMKR